MSVLPRGRAPELILKGVDIVIWSTEWQSRTGPAMTEVSSRFGLCVRTKNYLADEIKADCARLRQGGPENGASWERPPEEVNGAPSCRGPSWHVSHEGLHGVPTMGFRGEGRKLKVSADSYSATSGPRTQTRSTPHRCVENNSTLALPVLSAYQIACFRIVTNCTFLCPLLQPVASLSAAFLRGLGHTGLRSRWSH